MTLHWVTRVLLLVAGFMQSYAQLTISTSTPTPCYGDVVTLVCHHPELASNPTRYLTTVPTWRENGVGITPSDGTMFEVNTAVKPTHTNLTITITVDHFRNKLFSYSCFLVLAENGLPTGELETSGVVTVDPVELSPIKFKKIVCLDHSVTLKWISNQQSCYASEAGYNIFWNKTDNSTLVGRAYTTAKEYNITNLSAGVYTVTVQTVVSVLGDKITSEKVTENAEPGSPKPICYEEPCSNRNFSLHCKILDEHKRQLVTVDWFYNGQSISSRNTTFTQSENGKILSINVTDSTIGSYNCSIKLRNGLVVTGVDHDVEPLDSPKPPEDIKWDSSSSLLSWKHRKQCFEEHEFTFIVECIGLTPVPKKVNGTNYTLSGLLPGKRYDICITAVSTSYDTVKSGSSCITVEVRAQPPKDNFSAVPIALILAPTVCVVILCVVAAAAGVTVFCLACWKNRGTRGKYNTRDSSERRTTKATGNKFSNPVTPQREEGRETYDVVTSQGIDLPQISRNLPQSNPQRTEGLDDGQGHTPSAEEEDSVMEDTDHKIFYAELSFTKDHPNPVPPPPVESVIYSKTENTADNAVVPELPPKHNHQKIKEFKDAVINILTEIGVRYLPMDPEKTETIDENIKGSLFKAEYNGIHFLAICVHTTSDLDISHVDYVTRAKHLTRVSKGLLMSNQPTIPSKCLLTLEGAGCQFVPVSGYGEKGWEVRMVDKFKDVFPKVANNDSKSEDLPTSEQVDNSSPMMGQHKSLPPASPVAKKPPIKPRTPDKISPPEEETEGPSSPS